jgi:hypothetical protein
MLINMQNNILKSIEAIRTKGSANVPEGSVDSRMSSPALTSEPAGFRAFLKRETRQYARITILTDPASVSLVADNRVDVHGLFIIYVDNTSNCPDMIAHTKGMKKLTVRNPTGHTRLMAR